MRVREAGLVLLCFGLMVVQATAAATSDLSIYGKLPGFEMASLSPSGRHVAILGDVGGKRRVVVLEGGKTLRAVAEVGDAKVRGLHWAGDTSLLIYSSNADDLSPLDFTARKAELFSMQVLPLDGGKPWFVFDGNRNITGGVRGFYGVREKNGEFFGYFGGITYEDRGSASLYLLTTNPMLYEVSFGTQKSRRIASRIEGDAFRGWIVGPEGEVSASLDYYRREGKWSIRNAGGKVIASGVHPTGGVSLVGLGTSPQTVIYALEDEDGNDRWMELPLAGGDTRQMLEDVGVREAVFDQRTRRLVGYAAEGDYPVYHFFDRKMQGVIDGTVRAFAGKSLHLEDWNDAFDQLIVRTLGDGDPGTWWLVDIASGKAVDLGVTYALRPRDVGKVRTIQYSAGDGLKISGVLTLPPDGDATGLPVVVLPHGGPAARDYPEFDWWAQALASRGYAVLQPNFRGSTGYGAAFQRAGDGEWGRAMQSDISDGLAYLASSGTVDPARACIVGASYGGYAALAGVTLQQGLYRCAAAVSGISDLAKFVGTEIRESGSDNTLIRILRQQIGSGSDLRAVSPIRFAAAADAPVLLVHGKDDSVVGFDQSADMAKALQAAGKPFEFIALEGEDHWLSRSETRLAMLQAVVEFVEKHNPARAAAEN